jgi:FKBP-type peptidyl-prolyl cis-trans isomerase
MALSRHAMINGLFYGIDGMRVGGLRRLEIAPHLAYGDRGVPDVIPSHAVIIAEVTILAACSTGT